MLVKDMKKMKQMKMISILWGAILLGIVILLTIFGILFNKKNKIYTDMEEDLVNKAQKYVETSFLYPQDNKTVEITLKELQDAKLIDEFEVENALCDGYVTLKKDNGVYKYKGYINCPEYKTKNYAKNS